MLMQFMFHVLFFWAKLQINLFDYCLLFATYLQQCCVVIRLLITRQDNEDLLNLIGVTDVACETLTANNNNREFYL